MTATCSSRHPKQAISRTEWGPLDRAPEHRQLVTKGQVHERDCSVSAADQRERSERYDERGQHSDPVAQSIPESTGVAGDLVLANDTITTRTNPPGPL
jgi:hypothetical protein